MFEVQEALEQQKMEFNRKVCHKSVTHNCTDLAFWTGDLHCNQFECFHVLRAVNWPVTLSKHLSNKCGESCKAKCIMICSLSVTHELQNFRKRCSRGGKRD